MLHATLLNNKSSQVLRKAYNMKWRKPWMHKIKGLLIFIVHIGRFSNSRLHKSWDKYFVCLLSKSPQQPTSFVGGCPSHMTNSNFWLWYFWQIQGVLSILTAGAWVWVLKTTCTKNSAKGQINQAFNGLHIYI